MTKRLLLGMSVILSTAIAAPVYAQSPARGSDAQTLYFPKPDLGVGAAQPQRRDVSIVSHDTDDAMPSVPSIRPWRAGTETATRPWSAPVGHHQPSAANVLASTSATQPILEQDDANVDRIVRSICRGC